MIWPKLKGLARMTLRLVSCFRMVYGLLISVILIYYITMTCLLLNIIWCFQWSHHGPREWWRLSGENDGRSLARVTSAAMRVSVRREIRRDAKGRGEWAWKRQRPREIRGGERARSRQGESGREMRWLGEIRRAEVRNERESREKHALLCFS